MELEAAKAFGVEAPEIMAALRGRDGSVANKSACVEKEHKRGGAPGPAR
jgi:hypothetical protein